MMSKVLIKMLKNIIFLKPENSGYLPEDVVSQEQVQKMVKLYTETGNFISFFYIVVALILPVTIFLITDLLAISNNNADAYLYAALHGFFIIFLFIHYYYLKLKKIKKFGRKLSLYGGAQLLFIGNLTTAIDQLSSGTISAYMICSMLIGAFIFYSRRELIIIQSLGWVVFCLILFVYQKNPSLLYSNLMNGFCVFALSVILGIIRNRSLFRETASRLMNTGLAQSVSAMSMKKYHLTVREREILNHLLKGAKYKDIADDLAISLSTVKTHIENIYKKMKVSSRAQLMKIFYQ